MAFNSLFGASRPVAARREDSRCADSPTASQPATAESAYSGQGSGSQSAPLDLTADGDGQASEGEDRHPSFASQASSPRGTDASSAAAPDAWFAVSSLTGRVHAFGDGDEPLAAGLGASALPHAILDDDESSLPAALRCPSMLAAARRWVTDYTALTSAQRVALHDRPVKVPLTRAVLRPPPPLPLKPPNSASSQGRDPATKTNAFDATSRPTNHAACTAPCVSPPIVNGKPEAASHHVGTVGGSRMRETTSERWAAAHYPTSPHVTRTWRTERTATTRIWTQHFSVEHALPHCLYCLALHQPAPDSPFCSERCAAAYTCAETGAAARRHLFERELGVCQLCGFDAHQLFQRIAALPTEQDRLQVLMGSPYSTLSARMKRMLTAPKEGDFWEADHIIPVAEGGGETSLDNFQTLCVPCHTRKTAQQAADKVKRKRLDDAEGTADLRQYFAS